MQQKILHHIDKKKFPLRKEYLIALILIIITAISYWQVKDNDFISFDDPYYVTQNPQVQKGLTIDGALWAFTSIHAFNWHPLTSLSHMMDVQLFGLKPGGHHLTSLIFHIANTLLLFMVLTRMTGAIWQSALVAVLFACHPLHVESVAWISERKDILSTFFLLLTIFFYIRYVENPKIGQYLLVVLFFAFGLMAKQMLVTLPFVLLLLDYWPLNRLDPKKFKNINHTAIQNIEKHTGKKQKTKKVSVKNTVKTQKNLKAASQWSLVFPLLKEKIPLFILAAAASIVVFLVQHKTGIVKSAAEYSLQSRIENALVSYVLYMSKMIWPVHLAVFYPHSGDTLVLWQVLGALLLLSCITIIVLVIVKKPYLTVGWLWYLGTLVPVIGLVQVGLQSMADRYTYVPLIGLFIMIAWGVHDISKGWKNQKIILGIFAGILLFALSVCTWVQVKYWRNSETLFEYALKVTKNNWFAHYSLAKTSQKKGNIDEAIQHYQDALRIMPIDQWIHKDYGLLLAAQGNIGEAISHFQTALQLDPSDAKAREFLEMNLGFRGNIKDAISHYRNALRLNPSDPYIHYLLGEALAKQGNFDESLTHLKEALRIKPNFAEAHNGIGIVFASRGNLPDAIFHFHEALKIKPNYRDARDNLKVAIAQQKKRR